MGGLIPAAAVSLQPDSQQFGNGVSGTLSLEDGKVRKRGNYNGVNALSLLGVTAPTVDTRGGNTWPEIVGTLRVEQPWGGLHGVAAMVVNNHVAYNCGGRVRDDDGCAWWLLGACGTSARQARLRRDSGRYDQDTDRRERRALHRWNVFRRGDPGRI